MLCTYSANLLPKYPTPRLKSVPAAGITEGGHLESLDTDDYGCFFVFMARAMILQFIIAKNCFPSPLLPSVAHAKYEGKKVK